MKPGTSVSPAEQHAQRVLAVGFQGFSGQEMLQEIHVAGARIGNQLDFRAVRSRPGPAAGQAECAEIAERFHVIGAELRKDGEIVADFTARLSEAAGEAWHDVKAAAERAVERLEGDVATARADLTAELADDPTEYRTAAREQADTWKAHHERLKLHAKLGEMEARDKVAELEEAYQRAKPELGKAGEAATETLDALKTQVRGLVDHLRRAARDFSDDL